MPRHDGAPTGEYEDFLTGFVADEGHVWRRPVGVAMAADGALLVSDDGLELDLARRVQGPMTPR